MFDDVSESPPELLTTPFEDWCFAHGLHPESPGAWDHFASQIDGQSPLAS